MEEEEEENRREEGGWEGGLVLGRWSDYEERKGTAGGTTGKKRRMRKAALLGERRGRAKMAERERVKADIRVRVMRDPALPLSRVND